MSTLIRGVGRLFLILALGATSARLWAQPPLTTIRDTVYRADGRPFSGLVLIEWKTFQASNDANIGRQGTTVAVVNGNLFVRLTPTTTANNAYYLVRYNSDGQFQFSEIWSVPASTSPLRLRDIRATLLPGGILTGGGSGGVVVGETSGGVPGFGDSETPAGAIDGTNAVFTLANAPSPAASLALLRNGLLQTANNDYTLSGATITFNPWAIPQLDDILEAYYRTPATGVSASHSLLSTIHSDTTPSSPTRGGLVVGTGANPTWSQLPLGQAGRCLTSNGTDAIWSPCLFTGLTPGAVPFVDSNGSLTQNTGTLAYNNINRKFSIGNSTPRATLNVHDASANGTTELTVRAGLNQGSVPMQTWISNAGQSLAFVNADGSFNVRRLLTNSSSNRPGLSDPGTMLDPAPAALADGDSWFNNSNRVRKTFEAGQVHGAVQVVCSNPGVATSAIGFTDLGTCTIPANYLFAGDRLEVEATFLHLGGTSDSEIDLLAGSVTLAGRAVPAGDDVLTLRLSVGFANDLAAWSAQTMGAASSLVNSVGQTPFASGMVFGPIRLRSRIVTPGADSMRLINFTVRRVTQQSNP